MKKVLIALAFCTFFPHPLISQNWPKTYPVYNGSHAAWLIEDYD
jgi:hypothetical protein